MQKPRGHTLPELMACLLVLSIMLSAAAPKFSSLILDNQKIQQTNILLGLLHYARYTAVQSKEAITVCAGAMKCSHSARWSNSLLVFPDRNDNGTRDDDEPLLRQISLDNNFSWEWLNFRKHTSLIYERNGTTRALNGTFTLCKKDTALYQVVVSLSGRIRTQAASNSAPCL